MGMGKLRHLLLGPHFLKNPLGKEVRSRMAFVAFLAWAGLFNWDYILAIAISVTSGLDAIFNFPPPSMAYYKIYLSMALIFILLALSLRVLEGDCNPYVYCCGFCGYPHRSNYRCLFAGS